MLSLALCGPVAEGFGVFVPLEKGDPRGSEATSGDPLPQKARESLLKASIPWLRGTKELHLSPNVQAPDHSLALLAWTGLWFVTTLTAFVLLKLCQTSNREPSTA
jgi:hypothetical protein